MEQEKINSLKALGLAGGGVTLNTLIAGENLTTNKLVVEHSYTPFNITLNATLTIIKSTAGLLHNINIGMLSNPTITIFDNASGASGTVLLHVQPLGLGAQDSYLIDLSFSSGATAWVTGGNAAITDISITAFEL